MEKNYLKSLNKFWKVFDFIVGIKYFSNDSLAAAQGFQFSQMSYMIINNIIDNDDNSINIIIYYIIIIIFFFKCDWCYLIIT